MEKKINLNEEIIPPIINDRVSPTNNNLKKSISHNLEKNEINARRNLIQEKLKLKKLQIKKGNNLELYKYKSEKLNYPFTSNHQSICSSNLENLNENNNNIHYKKFNKKLKVKLNLINYFSQL
jgi:hypothetical protein